MSQKFEKQRFLLLILLVSGLAMLVAIILVAADTGFQYFSLDDSIYTGHPVDILFLWSYVVLVFGVYGHIKIFKTEKKSLNDKENLR